MNAASPANPTSPVAPAEPATPVASRGPAVGLPTRADAAIAGLVTALVALGIGELIAGLLVGAPSPLSSVGSALIDLAPPGSKDVVVGLFGTNDKAAIGILVAAAVLLVGALTGIVARTRPLAANAVILIVVAVGALAALRQSDASFGFVALTAGVQAVAAVEVLSLLLGAARPSVAATAPATTGAAAGSSSTAGSASAAGSSSASGYSSTTGSTRRGFLVRAGVLGGLALVGGGIGRMLLDRRAEGAATAAAEIPSTVVDPAAPPPADASFAIEGLSPVVTPNEDFYRIDTALITPAVDINTWKLRVHGMVDREVSLTFSQLVELPLIERYVTIACVSNEVGGHLVGNAKWTGVRLTDVLDMAGVQAGATQIVPRSVDGWSAGFPTTWATAPDRPRDALIAVKMNDAPLPAEHGFPARLIVPGLYGYVSATKWLSEIELTTLEAFDAYWVPRGWAKEGPILTQSRIDVPQGNATVKAGPVAVAGVAWAPDRGISRVEVSVDGGAWNTATMATEIAPATWVQWTWTWQAAAGDHVLEVRATDGKGEVQTAQVSRPDPDGARGHHKIAVRVA